MERANENQVPRVGGITKYEVIREIGQGAYGEVSKAKHRVTGELVALKKVQFMINGKASIFAKREMIILFKMKHKNIVKLNEVCFTPNGRSHLYLIMELCEYDLADLLGCQNERFSVAEIKEILSQLFQGLSYLHDANIMHRDIKSDNILINKVGDVKIADFGMARLLKSPPAKDVPSLYTPGVTTLWYRPPEVLLKQRHYSPAVDMWAAGCVMAELFTKDPILQGKNELHQLQQIVNLCGSITAETFPEVKYIEWFEMVKLPKDRRRRVTERLKVCVQDKKGLDVIEKLLTINPDTRVDANTVLKHEFFNTEPLPCNLKDMVSRFTEFKATLSREGKTQGFTL